MLQYETLSGWFAQLENMPFAVEIAESSWMFPILETLHVIGLSTVVGTIAVVDLRLLNLASRSRSVRALTKDMLPYTWIGFSLALLTGALMFASKATTYIHNVPFLLKMGVLAAAGFNMISFHFLTYRSVERWDREVPTPTAARVAGAASLVLWMTVVFLGRWIAYVE